MPTTHTTPQLTIRSLNVRAVNIPMKEPHRTASGTVSISPLVLIDLVTEEGIVGHSYVFPYMGLALKPVADLVRNLEPLVRGESLHPAALSQKLRQRFRLLGPQGLVGIALAGIDMALWDAAARACEMSLVELLGGAPGEVPVYGAIGFDGVVDSAKTAERWVSQGVRAVKAKIGYPTVREDVEVVKAIRSAVGDDVLVMVDYNQCLTVTEALQRCQALDDLGLAWIEEPTLAHDFRGHARIAAETRTAIQAGENWWGPGEVAEAVRVKATDYLMPDVMKIGGVTGWMQCAAIAEVAGLRVCNHLFPEVSAQLMRVTPTAFLLEYSDWWVEVIAEPMQLHDGKVTTVGAKGSGVQWNEEAVSRLLVP
jgi:mandelate racemase